MSRATMLPQRRIFDLFLLTIAFSCLPGCESAPPEPGSRPAAQKAPPIAKKERPEKAKTEGPAASGDPAQGEFTLADATKGLAGEGKLYATLDTSLGKLDCELYEDRAPITVANFVGLARGLRPFKHKGAWVTRPAYDGTTFHRVIKGFMIQGGDPEGTGKGQPGYVIPDEIWPGAKHDRRGLLCMANRGPNTNGMQFFITDAAAAHLDRSYTIFGLCGPDEVMEKLSSVPTHGPGAAHGVSRDRPLDPPKISSISIARK